MVKTDAAEPNSCGSQPLSSGTPTREWGVDELGSYAQLQNRQIVEGEKLLTPSYWRLGQALTFAKKSLNHGQWGRYLKELGIDKSRASKARAIYGAFANLEDVAELTVEGAYSQRPRKKQTPVSDSKNGNITEQDTQRVRKSIEKIAKQSGDVAHDAAFAGPQEAAILIPSVRKAIDELRELLRYLEEQVPGKKQSTKATNKSTAKK